VIESPKLRVRTRVPMQAWTVAGLVTLFSITEPDSCGAAWGGLRELIADIRCDLVVAAGGLLARFESGKLIRDLMSTRPNWHQAERRGFYPWLCTQRDIEAAPANGTYI